MQQTQRAWNHCACSTHHRPALLTTQCLKRQRHKSLAVQMSLSDSSRGRANTILQPFQVVQACMATAVLLLQSTPSVAAATHQPLTVHPQQQYSEGQARTGTLQQQGQLPAAPVLLSSSISGKLTAISLPHNKDSGLDAQLQAHAYSTTQATVSQTAAGDPPVYQQQLPPLPTTFPELAPLSQPHIGQQVLPNGLRVFVLQDKEVPLIQGSLLMAGGQLTSPADKVGLASIAAAVQRAGGSLKHPSDIMDNRLEDLAAAIEASAGQQSTTIDFQCMSRDAPEVLRLLAELVQQPALPDPQLKVIKDQVENIIGHRDDGASNVARRELYKLVYGQNSIYTRSPTLSGVASITAPDLAQHLATWQRPDAALLGLVGDFETSDMMKTVQEVFGSWTPAAGQPAQPPVRPLEDVQVAVAPEGVSLPMQQLIHLIDRPGAEQASVVMGEVGVALRDADVFALDVLSSHFNSFGGVLFDKLRTREGLAYSVAASWDSPADHRGLFVAAAETVQPAKLIQELAQLLEESRQTPMSGAELARAKANLLNSFVFNFSSSYSQLQRSLVYQLLGLPEDFLFRYRDNVQAVTSESVMAAAAAHLHPAQQQVVVVGDASVIRPQLEQAGFRVEMLQPAPAA